MPPREMCWYLQDPHRDSVERKRPFKSFDCRKHPSCNSRAWAELEAAAVTAILGKLCAARTLAVIWPQAKESRMSANPQETE